MDSKNVFDNLLAEKNRVILIAGGAGVGKTRFAAAVARHYGRALFISTAEERAYFSPQVYLSTLRQVVSVIRTVRRDHLVVVDDLWSVATMSGNISSEDVFREFLFEVESRSDSLPQVLLTTIIDRRGHLFGGDEVVHRTNAVGFLRTGSTSPSIWFSIEKNRGAAAGVYDVAEHIVGG